MEIVIEDRPVGLSEAGWLNDPASWTEAIAAGIAREVEKVEMTDEHWDIVREARAYYDEYGTVPEQRVFSKLMKEKYGPDRATQQYFYRLFPYGLIKSAFKIAGLPRPKGCS